LAAPSVLGQAVPCSPSPQLRPITFGTPYPPQPPPCPLQAIFDVANQDPDIFYFTPLTRADTPGHKFEDAINTYALCTRALKVAQHWYPDPHVNAPFRTDFFREVDILISLVKAGTLNPWKMLADWFNAYENYTPGVWNPTAKRPIGREDTHHAVYSCIKTLANQLSVYANVNRQEAEEEMKQLCVEFGVNNFEYKLDRRLQGVRQGVEQDFKDNGCLHLREILAGHQDMVKTVRFSKHWSYDD
jgi:hypothetical protein